MMRKALALLLVALLIHPPLVARADDDDLFALNLKPNVLLLLDASGSMNATDAGAYNVQYGIDLNTDGITACPGAECVADLDVDGIANTRNDAALKVVLDLLDANGDGKVDPADEAALGVRLGFMSYTAGGDSSGSDARQRVAVEYSFELISPFGTPYADIKKAIVDPVIAKVADPRIVVGPLRGCSTNSFENVSPCNTLVPKRGYVLDDTPTAEALEYVEHYFLPQQLFNDPDGACRQNFIILVTDGASDGFTPPETIAASLYNNGTPKAHGLGVPPGFLDRRGTPIPAPSLNPEPQYSAKTFAVGFSGGDPAELNRVATAGGTGTGFFPTTIAGLSIAVKKAIATIQAETFAVASPVIPASRVTGTNVLYAASFTPSEKPFWYGELSAYPLQSDGTIQTDAAGTITATPLWQAHTVLNGTTPTARRVKTVVSGTTVTDFAKTAAVRTALKVTKDLTGDSLVNDADADYLIDYVRGVNGTSPAWKLGDIYHSRPVLIGPPSKAYVDLNLNKTVDTSFATFRDTNQTRDRVLYTGSNAGLLQAFHAGTWAGTDYDTGTGAERWAFAPPNLLPRLQDMVSAHTYYVDGAPKAADVWLGSNPAAKAASDWRTVIVTGERRGGNAYFALDVTSPGTAAAPNPPTYLWSFTDPNLGQTWSQPAIGKVRLSLDNGVTTTERWVAFVGGGYLPSTDTTKVGRAFFVIDMNTGTKLWQYTEANNAKMGRIPAAPTPVDTDGDGFVDRVYVGDLAGNIWRFDLQAVGTSPALGTLVTGWTGSRLFENSTGRPFYNKVAVAAGPGGFLWVYGGTGDLNNLLSTTTADRFYGIKEPYPKATGTPPSPVPPVVMDLSLANTAGLNTLNVNDPAFNNKDGWFLPLPGSGEKSLSDPEVFAQVLLFTSFTPTVATCTKKAGTTTLYALFYLTGGGATDYAAFESGTAGLAKSFAPMSGLSGGPIISLARSGGDAVLTVCTSSRVCGNPPPPQPGNLRTVDYWREF